MNLNKISLIAAVAALMLTGCNNDLVLQSEASDKAIEFRTVMDKTRASLIDSKDEITSFFVHAGLYGANDLSFMKVAAYNDGTPSAQDWTYAPKKYWPTDNSAVSFYAYAPIKDMNMQSDLSINIGEVSFEYVVPYIQNRSNSAVDLLVASVENQNTGVVNFSFDHALSSVIFSAENHNPEESELVYTISRVAISNLFNKGIYKYGEGWDPNGKVFEDVNGDGDIDYEDQIPSYVAGIPESGVAVNPGGSYVRLLSLNDYMMVLPQTSKGSSSIDFENDSFVEVTFSLKDGEGAYIFENKKVKFSLYRFTFEKGSRYNFKLTFSRSGYDEEGNPVDPNVEPIVLDVIKLNEWGEGDGYDGEDANKGTIIPVEGVIGS